MDFISNNLEAISGIKWADQLVAQILKDNYQLEHASQRFRTQIFYFKF
jgi:hypothetical protein